MKKAFLFVIVLCVLMSCRSVKSHNEQITKLHAVIDLRNDIDKVYKQLQRHHPRLYQYTPKEVLDFKIDSLKAAILKPINSRDFYKELAPVLTHVRQGHVSLGSANKRYTKKERKLILKRKFGFYNLDFEYLEDKLWVKNTRGKDSIIVGCEVVKIDDDLVTDLIRIYKTRFASDGFNTTLYNGFVGRHFANFYFKDKGFRDSLILTFRDENVVFSKIFRRVLKKEKHKKKDSATFVKPKRKTKIEKKASRLASKKKRKLGKKQGYISKTKKYTRNFRLIEEDSTVAYMKLRSFTNGNYKRFYKESFAKLKANKTKYLILDLRDNGGGRIAEINYLYSYLTLTDYTFLEGSEVNSRLPFLKMLMSNTTPNSLKVLSAILSPVLVVQNLLKTKKEDGKLYYKFKYTRESQAKPLHFTGDIYVLINGSSFSASSLISTHLKANKRAVFVGEETGGAYNGTVAGIYKIYELPTSKLKIRMGLMHVDAPFKQAPDGYGVKPDIEILPTLTDLKLKKDRVLDWVLTTIKNKEEQRF